MSKSAKTHGTRMVGRADIAMLANRGIDYLPAHLSNRRDPSDPLGGGDRVRRISPCSKDERLAERASTVPLAQQAPSWPL